MIIIRAKTLKFLLIGCWLLIADMSYGQGLRFDQFVIEDGLTSVNAIIIDEYGYKWFGGTHGLYKYDGYEFEIFTHDPDNINSISHNDIMTLFEDDNHDVWIGMSTGGVNVYHRRTGTILRLSEITELSMSSVTSFEEDAAGNIWIATLKSGIFVLDRNKSLKKRFTHNFLDNSSLSNNDVFDFLTDAQGNFWIVTNSGSLDLFQSQDSSFVQYTYFNERLSGVRSGQKLIECDSGKLWIGTEGYGIFEFDISSKQFKNYSAKGPNSITNNIITGLAKNSEGNIWISTDGGGLNYYNTKTKLFSHHTHDAENEFSVTNDASYSLWIDRFDRIWLGMGDGRVNISSNSPFHFIRSGSGLSHNVVVDLLIDKNGLLWVATGGGGIDLVDIRSKNKLLNISTHSQPLLKTDVILTVHEDANSNIWAGTFMEGANQFDEKGRPLRALVHNGTHNNLSNNHIFDIGEDERGNVWFATQGGGVDRYNPSLKTFKNYNSRNNSGLISDRIQTLLIDHKNRVWVGHFNGGVQVFDRKTKKFVLVELPQDLGILLNRFPVHAIYEDAANNILFCTGGAGLIAVSSDFDDFNIYNKKSGLPSDAVYGVLEFNDKYWVSTNAGIAEIDRSANLVNTIDKSDGLLTTDFESGSIATSFNGELYFGSKEGVVYFDPESLNNTSSPVEVIFTDLAVFNRPVKSGDQLEGQVVLKESLLFSDEINLPFTKNNFSISFACPAFDKPTKLLFRYRLKGLDDRWVFTRHDRRFVNYANLHFGNYKLDVQASTDGGKSWGTERSLRIVVRPPLYRTRGAYLIYIVVLCVVIYVIYSFIRGRIALQNQLKFEKFSREKDNDLSTEKINFFTGVSHEIRTPLTLILGHLERLAQFENLNGKLRYELSTIRKNGNRLLVLINQLLDFRKMESGQMVLKVANQDITQTIKEILLPFMELAIQQDISLQFKNELTQSHVYFDASKLEIIVYNLLSNSLKFTPSKGKIDVVLRDEDGNLLIQIVDTGQGITKENMDKIFQPFFQGNAGSQHGVTGTGIGLSLVKEVIEIHHGKITVQSELNNGTKFNIWLPINKEDYQENEIVEMGDSNPDKLIDNSQLKPSIPVDKKNSDVKLLLVEDNLDILTFLQDNFKEQYEVFASANGKEGLKTALEIIPDIIISDVMMPEMDGIELCRHLKQDIRTNHIPIILLTARTGFMHEHSGLETGADDYITKPFKFELLNIRTLNLIENRKLIHQKFRKELLLEPKKIDVDDPNEQFLSELMNMIEENISDAEYTVKDLAKSMGLSHSVLYRKIHALTNLSINDFIKSIRLKRATQLLKSGAYGISDVGYMVGFSNPKYFSTCFKAEFDKSPSEYIREQRAEDLHDETNSALS